uniref:CRC domain-containing protein n=1 Tax=Oryza meridionalis TaxID=40149 RepID=A0A0E0EKX8_9ORYZ
MEKPLQLCPGSVKIDFASASYAGKADIAATAAALSHALGPPRTPPCYQLPLAKVNSSLPLWPPVICPSTFAQKRPMSLPSPPPAKKLQVQQSSSMLPQDFPKLEVLPVEKPTKLQVRRSPQHVSLALKQGSPKMERPLLPRPATFIDVMLSSQKPSIEMWSETKDVTLTRKTNCSCKYSKCLKLYCECFEKGRYCIGCNCTNCCNNVNHENARQEAINVALERNPAAFMPKVSNSTAHNCESKAAEGDIVGKHTKGCKCKRTECLKKYCECFKASVFCSENCRCTGCKNYKSNEDRISQKNTVHAHHVQNPASSGMVGQSVIIFLAAENDSSLSLAASVSDHSINNNTSHSGMKENTKRKKLNRVDSCLSSTNHDREAIQKEPAKQMCSLEKSSNEDSKAPDATPSTTEENLVDIFKEQEKRVLTNFRDYLCKLATCGKLQGNQDQTNNPSVLQQGGKHHSSGRLILARTKIGNAGIGKLMGQKSPLHNDVDKC